MSIQTYYEALVSRFADATQISNTTTETVLVPDYTFPANYFTQGRTIRGHLKGICSNVVTTPGTLTYRIHLGPLTLSAVISVASAALALDPVAHTSFPWELNFMVVCRTAGSSGTALVMGQVDQSNINPTAANEIPTFLPASAPAAGTLDTTAANLLGVSAQFSVATSPTNITCNTYLLESLI